jgi:DNA repair protein RecO (recombination protein O)
MSIVKTEGTVLRTFPYSETSLVVVWLTRDLGRLTTLAKGAMRPKSAFLGQIGLFYTCEILFYDRDQRDLCILRECSPLNLRPTFRRNWRACGLASYFADLLYRAGPVRGHQPGLFDFLDRSLDQIHQEPATSGLMMWLELKLLDQLGLAPRLRRCAACHRPLDGPARFDLPSGGAICKGCSGSAAPCSAPVTPDVLAVLSAWQRSSVPAGARNTRATPQQRQSMEHLLGLFIEHHLERASIHRNIALDLLCGST